MTSRSVRLAVAVAALMLCAPSAASAGVPRLPLTLPGDASAAGVRADRASWVVGARPGAVGAARLARRFSAHGIGVPGTYVVARGRARAFARALAARGELAYAQPDVLRAPAQARAFGNDPLDDVAGYRWRDHVVSPGLVPPARRKLIALVDATLDASHPEFAGGTIRTTGGHPVTEAHGTATASVAAAPQNGIGLTGLWPGGRALNVALDDSISCTDSATGIVKAIRRHASVINMSYGSSEFCVPEFLALEVAVGRGIVPVAAAGNELGEGNPVEYPATLPHVVTVGALDAADGPSRFSNVNAAVDLSAPGEAIPTAVPVALDGQDGVRDGYELQSGTSFAAPMVSAAIAWVRAARPSLKADQAADAVRFSARDISTPGYDGETGYGELDVDAALRRHAGAHDPGEPNDGPALIDGSLLGKAAPLIYKGRGTARRTATVDLTEDPEDWYRIRIPGHRTVHVTVRPRAGNPDLVVRRARGSGTKRTYPRIAHATHSGSHRERVRLVNRGRHRVVRFVGVAPGRGARLDAAYRLTVGR
jgi:hypothetical protein